MKLFLPFALFIFYVLGSSDGLQTRETEYNRLFGNPETSSALKHLRPGGNTTLTVSVYVGLVGVSDINERDGYMRSSLDLRMTWIDERLVQPFSKLVVPSDLIWVPDIDIVNRYSDLAVDSGPFVTAPVWIYPNGTVVYFPRAHVRTPCHFDLLHFPFDKQMCQIVFSSWGHSPDEMDIQVNVSLSGTLELALKRFELHSDWILTRITMNREEFSSVLPTLDRHPGAVMSISIKRQSSFYYRVFVAPAAMLLFLIPLIHMIPPGSVEKTVSTCLFIPAMINIFHMAADFFPAYSVESIPIVVHLYTLNMTLLFISFAVTVATSIIVHKSVKMGRVPPSLRKVCIKGMGFWCCLGKYREMNFELLATVQPRTRVTYHSTDEGEEEEPNNQWTNEADEYHELRDDRRSEGGVEIEMTDTQPILSGESDEDEPTAADRTGRQRIHRTAAGSENGEGEERRNSNGSSEPRQSSNRRSASAKALRLIASELQFARYKELVLMEWTQLAVVIDRFTGFILLMVASIVTMIVLNSLSS